MDEDYFFKIKLVGIGEVSKNILENFSCEYPALDLVLLLEKISDSEIENLVSNCDWLFVVADNKNLELAKKIENTAKCLLTNLFLFPTIDDINFDELEKNFGTVVILPEDKISTTKFTKTELVTKILQLMILSLGDDTLVGLDFYDVIEVMKNSGVMYVGFGEDSGENKAFSATKKSLQFPLMLCSANKLSNVFAIFSGGVEEISMKDVFNSVSFIEETIDYNLDKFIVYQVVAKGNFNGMTALVIAN